MSKKQAQPAETTSEFATVLIGKYTVHPYLTVVPEMEPDDYATEVRRVKECNGQFREITVDGLGRILAGREHLRALLKLGFEVTTTETKRDDPAWLVIDSIRAPKISHAQSAVIAARLLPHLKAEALARQLKGTDPGEKFAQGRASALAATAIGKTNEKYVELAAGYLDDKPEIIALIEDRVIERMSHAETLAGFKPAKFRKAVERIKAGEEPSYVLRKPKPSDDLWLTPKDIVIAVKAVFEGEIACDPCAAVEGSNVDATTNYTESQNGWLESNPWFDRRFVNPPFSAARRFVKRAVKEAESGKRIIVLLPIRPDSDHQGLLIRSASSILLLDDRVVFGKPGQNKTGTGRVSIMLVGLNVMATDLIEAGLEGIAVMKLETDSESLEVPDYVRQSIIEDADKGRTPTDPAEIAEIMAMLDADEADRAKRFAASRAAIAGTDTE